MHGYTHHGALLHSEPTIAAHSSLLWIGSEEETTFTAPEVTRLARVGFTHLPDIDQALGWLSAHSCDLIVLDLTCQPEVCCREMKALVAALPSGRLMVAANERQGALVAEAMRCGAADYVIKPFSARQLADAIQGALLIDQGEPNLIAVSRISQQLLQLARRAAKTSASVLIGGESGTGKECLARYIHEMSDRADKPFVAINCAAIPEAMLESILFGHAKGAFTGAVTAQPGKFEAANGGTLLLDEISELPLPLQAKLLRVLQEREVERLGSHRIIPLDVRIIAASNRDLRELVARGEFREDLFYRLDVLPLAWPALRDRPEDILPLAEHFLACHAPQPGYRFSLEASLLLQTYRWPGNVRELENVIQRALIMARGLHIQPADLMLPGVVVSETESVVVDGLTETRRQAEFRYVLETLRRFEGHRARTAEALGMTTRALRYKLAAMREQGIDIDLQIQQ
ncbi:sigma-54 dependent transcriptional regulator [Aeromonas schubertii]|uniref:sigma-54 dependent transcriptional regulator n=1 Tax=Aeromonas schubertii TaxID=652 RepID=UPI0009E402D7|nr:sigma-54 dependent transcriptional regulator [Aeromonas schubertii]